MLEDDLGVAVHSIVGPGYNARLSMAYLDAPPGAPARPKVVVTPTSLMMAAASWLEHPRLSYEIEAAALRDLARSR